MLKWFRGSGGGGFDAAKLGRPWGDRPSLFAFIARQLDPATGRLPERMEDLPDEVRSENKIAFGAGSMDGVFGRHFGSGDPDHTWKTVLNLVGRVIDKCDANGFRVLNGYLVEHRAMEYVDGLNPRLTEKLGSRGADVAKLGDYLLRNAADRESVKLGINLVGVFGDAEDHPNLLAIGAHDEFTLFAVVAMMHSGRGVDAAWRMAQRVTGWGRVQCVERMDCEIEDARIRHWLLTEGWNNSIMPEYSAAICARRGWLHEALLDPDVREDVIDGGAGILRALCAGQPGEGMAGYASGAAAGACFAGIVEDYPNPKILWLITCSRLEEFANSDDEDWSVMEGWTESARREVASGCERVRSRPEWQAIVADGLGSEDDSVFFWAAQAAPIVSIDPWEVRFARLLAGKDQWYWLLESPIEARIDRVLQAALRRVDLGRIATGPSDSLGFGPEFGPHRDLDWIVQALRRWPGKGAEFLGAALKSPVTRNRFGATRALLQWKSSDRTGLLGRVRDAHEIEPNAELKQVLGRILAGEVDAAAS